MRLVLNQGDDHAVQVEEEEDEVEAELGEGFLRSSVSAVSSDLGPALGRLTFLWMFSLRKISVASRRCVLSMILHPVSAFLSGSYSPYRHTSWRSIRAEAG